ncbi:MAG: type II toxin-antitoxin system RelE/ParE family toxin [Thermomicrobiales bacterium]|nr:type II toxin-antitoxin system RelE/ParE family toxin [Thermomicrobiales bacterium]MCO5221816.1 type II toxin-antitoxin system RelE/ParE family toxin [Thermomicrobiales bacterium]
MPEQRPTRYTIEFAPHASREFKKLPKAIRADIDAVIKALAENPRPYGYRKLHGWNDKYRVRVGNYRVVYEIHDGILVVLIFSVGDRADIYRRMKNS